MRVLHLLDPAVLRPTDYRRRTQALVDHLRAQGVQTVHLAGPGAPAGGADETVEAAPCEADSWPVYRTALPGCPGWLPRSCTAALPPVALALRLRQLLYWTRPDLIHAHAASSSTVLAALGMLPLAGSRRVPLVAEAERRGAGRRPPALERWALARAGALAAPSLEMRAVLRSSRSACRRIAVIPPPADLVAPCRERSPPGLEGAPLLAYAGRLSRDEGIDLLLAVLPALRKRHPALRLVVAGGGLREDELADRVKASGARGHVVITGAMSSQRAADVLPRADIAVFPALPGGAAELVPSRHLLNAMAQGCAIVASDIACHRELLVHGHSAMLFRAGSRNALAGTLLGLLDHPEHLAALGSAAAARAASEHSWTVTATRYRCLYEHVLAEQRGKSAYHRQR